MQDLFILCPYPLLIDFVEFMVALVWIIGIWPDLWTADEPKLARQRKLIPKSRLQFPQRQVIVDVVHRRRFGWADWRILDI